MHVSRAEPWFTLSDGSTPLAVEPPTCVGWRLRTPPLWYDPSVRGVLQLDQGAFDGVEPRLAVVMQRVESGVPGYSRREGGMRVLAWLVPPDLPRKVAARGPPYWPMCTCREQSRFRRRSDGSTSLSVEPPTCVGWRLRTPPLWYDPTPSRAPRSCERPAVRHRRLGAYSVGVPDI